MKKIFLYAGVIGFGLILSTTLIARDALAQTADDTIAYPVAELGNCKSKDACKTYCNDPKHIDACLAFAEKNNLMPASEIDAAKKFMAAGAKGPGGCVGQQACQTYCDGITHINECVAFAEKTGILPPKELAEAKLIQAAIAKGVQPPPCNSKKACDAYCDDPNHMKVCIAFGEAAGFLKGQELEDAKKMIAAIDNGATPPPCKGKEACDAYCSEPDHMEACMTFALKAGFMSQEEAQNSQKMLAALKQGVKPPPCKGKEACDAYCSEETHIDECINFSVAAGFMDAKDAEMARKTKGKGPGGCTGKESCDAFCQNPDNQQTCFNFARDNDLIPQAELQQMQEGQKQFRESMQNIPGEVKDCIVALVGNDVFEKWTSGQAMPPRDMGDKISSCFSKMPPPQRQNQSGQQGQTPGQGQGVPPISTMSQEMQDCVKSAIGQDVFDQLQSGTIPNENMPGLFEKAKECFGPSNQQYQTQPGQMPGTQVPPQGQMPPQGQGIPGTEFAPGTNPGQQFLPGQSMLPMMPGNAPGSAPCTGPNCPPPPGNTFIPQSGGMPPAENMAPGPQMPPAGQPMLQPPPPAPTSHNTRLNFLGAIISAIKTFLFGK